MPDAAHDRRAQRTARAIAYRGRARVVRNPPRSPAGHLQARRDRALTRIDKRHDRGRVLVRRLRPEESKPTPLGSWPLEPDRGGCAGRGPVKLPEWCCRRKKKRNWPLCEELCRFDQTRPAVYGHYAIAELAFEQGRPWRRVRYELYRRGSLIRQSVIIESQLRVEARATCVPRRGWPRVDRIPCRHPRSS